MGARISSTLLARLLADAAVSPRAEICGLLLGDDDSISDAVAAANVAHDPRARFEIDPQVLFAYARAERAGGPRVIGHYHSHPGGGAKPSPRDAEMGAVDARLWLVLAGSEATLWRGGAPSGLHGAFERVALVVEPLA